MVLEKDTLFLGEGDEVEVTAIFTAGAAGFSDLRSYGHLSPPLQFPFWKSRHTLLPLPLGEALLDFGGPLFSAFSCNLVNPSHSCSHA